MIEKTNLSDVNSAKRDDYNNSDNNSNLIKLIFRHREYLQG
jgi:hypothetical protein